MGSKRKPKRLEFWESALTRPATFKPKEEAVNKLEAFYRSRQKSINQHPFLSGDEIKHQQLERIKQLVVIAYKHVPFYHELYSNAGFEPSDLKSWEDFYRLPIVSKEGLLEAGLDNTTNVSFPKDDLYLTRSSGSTGKVLRIAVNEEAILVDTLQGIRQFWLQSEGHYSQNHLLTHVYTVPWWFSSVRGKHETAFISSLVEPEKIVEILRNLKTHVLSCYPSNLESLLTVSHELSNRLYLAVVHSEMSSKEQRKNFSKTLGVPVLDEYSSEELTRIALELPKGAYHVNEDAVVLDILNEKDLRHVQPGETGIAVGTNLLNEAMPFIRYRQGDYIRLPKKEQHSDVKWMQIESIEGRLNDSFVRQDGTKVPAGTLLDASYRWMFDSGIQPYSFEVIQTAYDNVTVNLYSKTRFDRTQLALLEDKVKIHLGFLLGRECAIDINVIRDVPHILGRKHRPIRREFKK
ncbi:MAG: hypothetical protein AABW46_01580 [Nanoarchaeota archaeon]